MSNRINTILLLLLFAGNVMAQSDGQFVIKKGDHYLAHVQNANNEWVLQDAEEFSPNCLWYSGREFNIAGTNHNYYFYDGANYRFLAAPMRANGELSLSVSLPETYLLNNSDTIYYFYNWDSDAHGAGVARGHQYTEATNQAECTACGGDWEPKNEQHPEYGYECWKVFWVEYDGSTWKVSPEKSYNITANGARYRGVEAEYHARVETPSNNSGLTAISVPGEMIWGGAAQGLSATISAYSYTYIPAYTTYTFEDETHNYCNGTDWLENTPGAENGGGSTNTVSTYSWTLSGEGATYLTLGNASTATPTLAYSSENKTGDKTAMVTLTVIYDDGATQTKSATVWVRTTCQSPPQASAPDKNYDEVTVSWYPTADSYKVYWKKTGETNWHSETTNATSYTITGLEYATEYTYKVAAFCGGDEQSIPSNLVYAFTTQQAPKALVQGAVFGGGRMGDVTGNTEVIVINCDGIDAVYGGNDIAGEVLGAEGSSITLGVNANDTYATTYNEGHVSNTVIVGDVYGGGNGYYTYDGHAPGVAIGTTLHTDHTFSSSVTDVGGSESYRSSGTIPTIKKTSITVTNNKVKADSIFGGAKNAFITNDVPSANGTSITIHGGTVFAVFGGNNFGGTQTAGKHHVEVTGTTTKFNTQSAGLGRDFGIGYVFGGGNKVQGLKTDVLITGGQCDTVFAGGNAASVAEAKVEVNCGFGQGDGTGTVFGQTYTNAIDSYDGTNLVMKDNYAWNGTGVYNVRTLFGGNNRADMNIIPEVDLTSGSVGTVYGGGNAGDMLAADEYWGNDVAQDFDGQMVQLGGMTEPEPQDIKCGTHVIVNSASMFIDNLYGGCQMSNVEYSTWVEVHQGHVGNVFGGCNISGDVGSEPVIPWSNGMPGDQYQYVKGATYVKAAGGTIYKNLFAGSNGYYHCNDGVNYIDGVINEGHYIGMPIPTHNETHVKVCGNVHVKGNVYAGGNLAPVGFIEETDQNYTYRDFVGFASVRMLSGTVDGDVYGGGNMASIYGSNEVRVSGGTINGALYGGNDQCGLVAQITNRVLPSGNDKASDERISLTAMGVHTYVGITGKPHINTVYGGGNGAYDYTPSNYCNPNDQPIQSNTFVDINIDATPDAGQTQGGRINTVYGGGNGVTVTGTTTVLVNVQNAGSNTYDQVGTIFGGNNRGDLAILPDVILLKGRVDTLYGGCNAGAMMGRFTVEGYPDVSSRVILRDTYTPVGSTEPMTLNGVISGAVYGGCRMSNVAHNTLVLVENGDHTAEIFGGCDVSGTVEGTSQVIVTGGSIIDAYGGGNGNYDYSSGGDYPGLTPPFSTNSLVEMLDGTAINLYAGGYAGLCGNTHLLMENGTVNGSIFGGGNRAGTTQNSTVDLNGGTVLGGIYGGCNSSGDIEGNVTVNINGNVGLDSYSVDVFGGGYGKDTETSGNVTVNIGDPAATSASACPVIYGSIYGGSALGNVNDDPSDVTTVNFLNGTLHGNLYGGGLGDKPSLGMGHDNVAAKVYGQVVVNIGENNDNPCFIDLRGCTVYGCNNTNGSPQDNVTVNVYKTAHTATDLATYRETDATFAIDQVFGGGNQADYLPENGLATSNKKAQVIVHGCNNTVRRVFGGGNAAASTGVASTIDGGRFDLVFGGGNGEVTAANIGGGGVGLTVTGGIIHQLFGGSNSQGTIAGDMNVSLSNAGICPQEIDEFYGGGNLAGIDGNLTTTIQCSDPKVLIHDIYGGANLASITGNVTLNVYGGDFNHVFGGSKGDANTAANIDGDVTLNLYGGTIDKAFGGCNVNGNITGSITVNVEDAESTDCPLVLNNVYGGGQDAAYTSDNDIFSPEVNIKHGTVRNNVFGGGLGATATVTANPVVTIGDISNNSHQAQVGVTNSHSGNVYGGGELAQVVGNTKVYIRNSNTVVEGTVYGGGKGSETVVSDGLVTRNTLVDMNAGYVKRSIYGGGELGSVGTIHYATNAEAAAFNDNYPFYGEIGVDLMAEGDAYSCADNTGLTEVLISGGQVGLNQQHMPDPNDPTADDDFGYVFCASKGMNSGDAIASRLAVSGSSHLKISGNAFIIASVYGGSENGQVLGNTLVEIEGGQIGAGYYKDGNNVAHWDGPYTGTQWTTAIGKVKNGTFTDSDAADFHECDAWPFNGEGTRYVYDYYAQYPLNGVYYYDENHTQSSNGGSNQAGDGHSFFGHVFGGGSGYYPYEAGKWRRSAGRVCGNTEVRITGGHILSNVYGGNEITDVLGHSKVEMSGGTVGVPRTLDGIQGRPVNSYIFGAGMGDPRIMFNGWSNVGSSEVTVGSNAVVFGSVFGGGEDGHVLGDASTSIEGDAVVGTFGTSGVDGNTFGGGRGFSAIALTAGVVCGNVTLSIKDNAKVLGSVYGGGRMAAVGTYLAAAGTANYGLLQHGPEHGNITVNITGGTIGNLSKINATNKYSIGDVFGGSKGILLNDPAKSQRLGLAKNAEVSISGASTRIYGSVYGGGELASVGHFNYATAGQASTYNQAHPTEPMTEGDVYNLSESNTGVATVTITGGTIGQQDFISTKGHVFGSCLGKAGTAYSGYSFVDQSHVTLGGDAVVYGSIFGGGENGHVLHDTDVKIQGGSVGIRLDTVTQLKDNMIFHGNVYGGGRGIDEVGTTYSITAGKVTGNTNVTVTGGLIYRNVYGGGSFASVGDPDEILASGASYTSGTAYVTVTGGVIGTDGGKSAYDYTPADPQREHRKENGFVFGSGRGVAGPEGSVYDHLAYANNTVVTIGGNAYITGSVFGGAENGHVKNNTTVTVNPDSEKRKINESITTGDFATYNFTSNNIEPYPVIGYPIARVEMDENLEKPRIIYRGNVYGGGRGIDPYNNGTTLSRIAGVVQNNTNVYVYGGTVRHDVYGGGSFASVGQYTYDAQGVLTGHVSGGTSTVTIDGGLIGMSPQLSVTQVANTLGTSGDDSHNLSGINNGQVFGGGRGESGLDSNGVPRFRDLAYVYETQVNIDESANKKTLICGAVFGGGCNGHVETNSRVTMTGGEIGHELSEWEKNVDFTRPKPIYFGNVYGGGRGIDHTNLDATISRTVGRVFGNTFVEISGGEVHHDVYGGGSLANVGTYTEDASLNLTFIDGTGDTYVNITGTAIIGTDGTDTRNAGFVYGSGRGMAGEHWSDMAFVNDTYVTIGTQNGSDNPQVKSSVFGGGSNGHVKGHTDVKVYRGTIGTPLTAAEMVEIDPSNPGTATRPRVYRGNVYGGGRGVERITSSSGQAVLSPTAGHVYGNTNVLVEGGTIYHNIYGGGSLASVGTYTIENNQHVFSPNTGKATVTITGGEIGMSPANAANVTGATEFFSGMNSGQVYGSGRGEAGPEYAEMAFTNETEVNVSGGNIYGAVFGGGANGHVKAHTQVNISGNCQIGFDDGDNNASTYSVYRGNVYGGGRGIDLAAGSTPSISPTAGKVYGNTEVNITGGVIYHNVFGGGSLASVGTATGDAPNLTFADNTGKTTINISGGQIGINPRGNGRVFGAGRGYPHPDLVAMTYVDKTEVNVFDGADIRGCVFGSGDNGQVYTEARVNMSGGTVGTTGGATDGNLFGSGRGVDTYMVGSTPTLNIVSGQVYGDTYVNMTGGTVKNNIYGGGYMASVTGDANVTVSGNATVGVSSNTDGGKVFGAGCGVDVDYSGGSIAFVPTFAKINGNTNVIVDGTHVNILSNVYGGGLKGAVAGHTDVTIDGATLNNVYGAGQGVENANPVNNADVCQGTNVTVNSGTVKGSVYGGGEYGSVGIPYNAGTAPTGGSVSTVNVEGGLVQGSAFGGGNLGFNKGATFMNLSGDAIVHENIFGGAYGSLNKVYVAGLHTVNMRGGEVYGNVYGGSRNADDALDFNGSYSPSETGKVSVVNISGGHAVNHVFASGYFGKAYGTVLAFIGANAIMNAPNNTFNASDPIYNAAYYNDHTALIIDRDIWAGADYGDYTAGQFGNPTITGQSNIYVDGLGYDTENAIPTNDGTYTENQFMVIRNSIYGCGTSCDAARAGNRHIIVRNYGKAIANTGFDPTAKTFEEPYTGATRDLFSIQRADDLVIENCHINFIGQGKVNSFSATEKYTIHEFNTVRVANNSTIIINRPIEQIQKLGSYICPDVYAASPAYTKIELSVLDPNQSSTYQNNKIRVNQGTYVAVVYRTVTSSSTETHYGELEGFFFMMTEGTERTFAFARPKQSSDSGNSIGTGFDNPLDGGFVSYHINLNTFSAGTLTGGAFAQVNDAPGTVTNGVQIPYDNHAPVRSGELYFRVWRYSDPNVQHTLREGVLNAIVHTGAGTSPNDFYRSEPVRITLPPSAGSGSYYKIQLISGEGCNITYGTEYLMVNAGMYDDSGHWMYTLRNSDPDDPDEYVYSTDLPYPSEIIGALTNLRSNPNNTFGLVAVPVTGLVESRNHPWLICNEAAEKLLKQQDTKWYNGDLTIMPEIDFYLTYSNAISGNNVWDPTVIFIEQYNAADQLIDEVEIKLTITTVTDISQTITSQTYALMFGNATASDHETYTTKILLPAYNVQGPDFSEWTLNKVEWIPETGFDQNTLTSYPEAGYVGHNDIVALSLNPSLNFDNSNGWHNNPLIVPLVDLSTNKTVGETNPLAGHPISLGETDGRNPISFNVILYYDAKRHVDATEKMGTAELTFNFTNQMGTTEPQELKIRIEVFRKGSGGKYYIDGVNGSISYSGLQPDAAKPNLANILYFTTFTPGDVIYIVDKITVASIEEREWNGQPYDKLRFYRYDGGHDLCGPTATDPHYSGYDYTNNPAYLGPLIDVKGKMTISSSLIDGSYNGNPVHPSANLQANAPLINVSDGGELTILGGTIYHTDLVNNYNLAPASGAINAGAINIETNGKVKINNYVYINDNFVEGDHLYGGGVYLAPGGTLLLSDLVTIDNNQKVSSGGSIGQNVYLPSFSTNISIGTQNPTDIYESLSANSKVGITKTDWNSNYFYMPVLYAEDGNHLDNLHCKDIVYDDQGIYRPQILEVADPTVADPENHLFFVKTWTTKVRSNPDAPNVFDASNIDSPEKLAWAISVINGLNGCTAAPTTNFTLTGDIDMSANIWDVIGNTDIANTVVYSGVFEGNGHTVKGIHSQLTRGNMGMFGRTVNATISNLTVETDFENGTADTLGTLAGTMKGGVVNNVKTLGILKGKAGTQSIGGVIGKITAGTLHSSFALNTIEGSLSSTVGGLVGTNEGNLFNSYSNIALGTGNTATSIGGLAGVNTGTIENCYVEFQGTEPSGFGWFANTNSGTISYCYSPSGKTQYCVNGTPTAGYGTYGAVLDRKAIGYLYDDNKLSLSETTNPHHSNDISYLDNKGNHVSYITQWPGMLSALNHWVKEKNAVTDPTSPYYDLDFDKWFRPISQNINHDLPVLAFKLFNAVATLDADPDFLEYGNLDGLLSAYNAMDANASVFLYDHATGVANVPNAKVKVSINEDVALLQSSALAFNNATVGITFDNSSRQAEDYFQNTLTYDWHLMSTSLTNAKIGAVYGKNGLVNSNGEYIPDTDNSFQSSPADIVSLTDSYFPNGLLSQTPVMWDFYSYFEPEYHWINLKRNKNNHFHRESIEEQVMNRPFQMDEWGGNYRHYQILYTGYTGDTPANNTVFDQADQVSDDANCVFVPGKGYMMAISKESYMNSTGTLNRSDFTIPVTAMSPEVVEWYSADRGSNLLGNPYQAYLDLDAVSDANSFLQGFWIYDADQGTYAPYKKNASENPAIPSQHIHPHQGFFVVYKPGDTDPETQNLSFVYSTMASATSEPTSYFRSERARYPLVNLYVRDSLGNKDLAIVEFNRSEVDGVKKIDNLRNADFKLYTHFNGEDYGLLFTPRKTARVPVFFKTPHDGTYTLTWKTFNGTFSTMRLIDNLTGANYDMLTNDQYTFDALSTDYAARFYIVFSVTDVNEFEEEHEIFAYFNGEGWVVDGQGQLELVDMLGQVLYADQLHGQPTIVHFDDFAAGVYMLRLVSSNKILKAQKIVIE